MNKKNGTQANSFTELSEKFKVRDVPKLELPSLPSSVGLSKDDLEKRAEQIREHARKAAEYVTNVLSWLANRESLTREAREEMEKDVQGAMAALNGLLSHSVTAYRRAATLAYLDHFFSKDIGSLQELKQLMADLVGRGFVEGDPKGRLQVGYERYRVSTSSSFSKDEEENIAKVLDNAVKKLEQLVRKQREEKARDLRAKSNITVKQLLDGEPGDCVLIIPAERYFDSRIQTERWRGGGTLHVSSADGRIYPVAAVGAIEKGVEEVASAGLFVFARTISCNRPPFIKPDEEGGLTITDVKKILFLWHLLKRGAVAAQENGARDAQRQELAKRATIPPEEFFLERKAGICLVSFEGVWKSGNGTPAVHCLFFLAERKRTEEKTTLQIVEVPKHLNDFFAQCRGEYPEFGEKFEGMPYPFNAVLQATCGQVAKRVRVAVSTQ